MYCFHSPVDALVKRVLHMYFLKDYKERKDDKRQNRNAWRQLGLNHAELPEHLKVSDPVMHAPKGKQRRCSSLDRSNCLHTRTVALHT